MWKKGGVWSQSDTCEDNKQVGVGQASVMYAISRPPAAAAALDPLCYDRFKWTLSFLGD